MPQSLCTWVHGLVMGDRLLCLGSTGQPIVAGCAGVPHRSPRSKPDAYRACKGLGGQCTVSAGRVFVMRRAFLAVRAFGEARRQ